jgi:2-oxoglutarate/2-oxoacid ferredoxin oxidoreductase subunit beta
MSSLEDLDTVNSPNWCPGCGNYGIWGAFREAAVKGGWDNTNTVMVAGIGCHGHIINFTKITAFEGLHGRAIPVATGIKLANRQLNVFVFSGDGDCLGEGGNHFIHGCRRNDNLTVMIHDNAIYGLTTGQTSPVSPIGFKSKSTPQGNLDQPLIPISLAITAGATFVARAGSWDIPKLAELITKANEHKGMAIIDIVQPCVTFNKELGLRLIQSSYYLDDKHEVTNKVEALRRSMVEDDKIPLGIFYQVERPGDESSLEQDNDSFLTQSNRERDCQDLFKKYQ